MLNMKESEVPKFLAEELSKEPYNLKLNLISFTSLHGDALMRVFQSVLIEIQPKLKEVLAEAQNEAEKVQEMMELLRILKFWPKCFDQHTLRTALEAVNQEIIWDTMGWLLTRKEELKKRAYLSLFLVKVSIPDEYLFDRDLQKCYEDYEAKIEEFKNVHKKLEEIKKHKGIGDLVNDLKAVESEVDSCSRKLDMMKCNVMVGNITEKEEHLQLAGKLRVARAEKSRLRTQLYIEERKLWCLEKKAYFLSNKVREIQELNSHCSPGGLLERIEQDCEILKFIVHHKIPQDMKESERKMRAMKLVLTAAPEFASDLEATRKRIAFVKREVMTLELKNRGNIDASLTFARQKAHENKKKKLELLEELEDVRKDMLEQQNVLREKRDMRRQLFPDGIPCLSSRDYKEYVKTMKVKAAKYKSMRADIGAVQTEVGILSTTKFIAQEELKESVEELKKLEESLGLVGFSCVHERVEQEQNNYGQNDESKMRHIYELSEKSRELQERVKAKKTDVEPLARGVIEAKQEIKTLELHSKRLNNAFEAEMGPILESIRRFETRISKIQEEIVKTQEEICQKTTQLSVLKANIQRAVAERELLKDNPTSLRSFKNRILTRVVDQERLQKTLNQEMSQLEQSQAFDLKQNELWGNLKRLLDMKRQLILQSVADSEDSN